MPGIADSAGILGGTANFNVGPSGITTGIVGINKQYNHFGPAHFYLDIIKGAKLTITPGGKKPPGHKPGYGGHGPVGPHASLNLIDIGKWSAGIPGIVDSTGKLGGTANFNVGPSGITTGIVGINKQYNHFGPAHAYLDIIKGAKLTITPGGKKPPGHKPCHGGHVGPQASLNLIDIGKWSAGIPGIVVWTGELGFKADITARPSGINADLMGINNQTFQIGPATFGFTFEPAVSLNIPAPGKNPASYPPSPGGDKPHYEGDKAGSGGDQPRLDVDEPRHNSDQLRQGSYDKPGHDGDKPRPRGDKPANDDKPGNGGDKPRPRADKPGQSGDKPGNDDDKLDNGGDKPRPRADKPANDDKPGNDDEKPRPGADKPGQSGDKPGSDGDKPSQGGDKPSGGQDGNDGD